MQTPSNRGDEIFSRPVGTNLVATPSDREAPKETWENEVDSWTFDFGKVGAMYLSDHSMVEPKSWIKNFISTLLSDQRRATIEEILKRVEEYKVGKEAKKVNPHGHDFIFVYGLKTFVLKPLTENNN